jgi:hypothetical protein
VFLDVGFGFGFGTSKSSERALIETWLIEFSSVVSFLGKWFV